MDPEIGVPTLDVLEGVHSDMVIGPPDKSTTHVPRITSSIDQDHNPPWGQMTISIVYSGHQPFNQRYQWRRYTPKSRHGIPGPLLEGDRFRQLPPSG